MESFCSSCPKIPQRAWRPSVFAVRRHDIYDLFVLCLTFFDNLFSLLLFDYYLSPSVLHSRDWAFHLANVIHRLFSLTLSSLVPWFLSSTLPPYLALISFLLRLNICFCIPVPVDRFGSAFDRSEFSVLSGASSSRVHTTEQRRRSIVDRVFFMTVVDACMLVLSFSCPCRW
ncbi:hypothetical protein BJX96DRAFT_27511 [Aspergillus floccosus]